MQYLDEVAFNSLETEECTQMQLCFTLQFLGKQMQQSQVLPL